MAQTGVLWRCACFTIILAAICRGVLRGVNSETYTVGDDEEWDTGTNYLTWSQKYNFSVGDILVFKYVAGEHDAYEVTEASYRSCNASTGVLAKYESGDDKVPLNEEKRYWFICNFPGHCLGGMMFTIDVKGAVGTPSSNTTGSGSPPAVAPSPPETNNDAFGPQIIGTYWLVAFGVVAVLQIILF